MLMFKSFYLKDIFGNEPIRGTRLTKENRISGNIPLVTAGEQNEGIAEYISNSENQTLSNMLTIDMFGNCFYRDYPYKSDDNILSFGLDDKSTEEMLYIASIINSICKKQYSYGKQYRKGSYLETIIPIPVIENSNPDHEYTVDDIDWQYMRDRITELERDRITELDAYLQATGLNDYELTEDDKKILSLSAKRASDENGTLEDNSEDGVRFGEFVMHDIFEKLKAPYKGNGKKQDNVSKIQTEEYNLPLINCKYNNNGIMYYGRKSDYTYYKNVLSVIYNGPPTEGQTYYQDEIGVYTDAYLIALKDKSVKVNREIGLYLTSVVNASIHNENQRKYSRGNKATWENKVENDKITIPIKSDGTPDFDYMERYIRAIEKVVIADVVKYKDKVIETTKKVVGE